MDLRGCKFGQRLIWLFFCITGTVIVVNGDGCPEAYFLTCVTRLRLQRVPFDQNMLNVVFNITSEAKLRQACIAYTDVLPCFRDRILQCGNEKQKQLLDEVAKMIMFFCSPFSVKRQETFLKHVGCIGNVLQMPATTDCYSDVQPEFTKIEQCRQICYDKREFLCMMKIWVSEQNLCTLMDIQRNCEQGAGEFYQQLQTSVFSDRFPIVCDFDTSMPSSSGTVPATKFAPSVDPMEFFRKIKNGQNATTSTLLTPTLPPSIPVYYSKTRSSSPPPVYLPTYIPVHPGQFTNVAPGTEFFPQSVTDPLKNLLGKNTNEKLSISTPKYPFDYPIPDAGRINGDSSHTTVVGQWKPWYLGGEPTTAVSLPGNSDEQQQQQRRVVLSDGQKSTGLWDSFKNSDLFNLGKEIFQGNNPFTRKEAGIWPFESGGSSCTIKVDLKLFIFLTIFLMKLLYT